MITGRAIPLVFIAAIGLLSGVANATAGSTLEEGWAAYARGDYQMALKLIQPFAEQGDPEVQYKLGFMYQKGQGVVQDYGEAVKWYRLSAERGQPFAQNNLGVMYKNGWGIRQDYVQAYHWFSLAAEYYFEFEEMNLERALQNRQGVLTKMTPEQISTAQNLTRAWLPIPYSPGAPTKLIAR